MQHQMGEKSSSIYSSSKHRLNRFLHFKAWPNRDKLNYSLALFSQYLPINRMSPAETAIKLYPLLAVFFLNSHALRETQKEAHPCNDEGQL